MLPERVPAAVGVKVTENTHDAPGASELPHVLPLNAKSPVTAMPVMLKTAWPVLLSVTLCAALVVPTFCAPKDKLLGAKATLGVAGVTPLPLSVTTCGLFGPLSFTATVPLVGPATVGVKVSPIVQVPPGASEPQPLLARAKSPVTWTPVKLRSELPVFVIITN